MSNGVRDGYPTADEVRQAMKLLQIPVNEEAFGPMTEKRQITAMLAIVAAWSHAYVFGRVRPGDENADAGPDPMTIEELHMLVSAAEGEVSGTEHGRDPLTQTMIVLNMQAARLVWVQRAVEEIDHGHPQPDRSLSNPISHIVEAAHHLIMMWTEAIVGGVKLPQGDGPTSVLLSSDHPQHAMDHMSDAMGHLFDMTAQPEE